MPLLEVVVDAMSLQGQGNVALELAAADAAPLPPFAAGAHVDLHLPNGLVRQYSIASAPDELGRYLLCVRREPASRGGSAYVHERLRVGDRLRISAPRNLFALQPARHHLLLAGGIGITPLLSMAQRLDREGLGFELHYYVQQRAQIAFAQRLATGFANGEVRLHCADEGRDARSWLPPGIETAGGDRQLYLCGPGAFMAHVAGHALAHGWDAGRIHREAFAPAVAATAPAGSGEEAFEVELASTGQVFAVPPGRSIAAVLGEAGVALSLSCEMGICGACLTDVLAGEPDHRDSVQSEQEKAGNRQMTVCCSRSRSPRLTLGL